MCSGSERKVCASDLPVDYFPPDCSDLLELSASDDLSGFKAAVEVEGHDMSESRNWYGRKIGSNQMGFEERTPLMIASMFGSKQILNYILEKGVDVNKACGSDCATALHCAVAGGSPSSHEVVKLLLDSSADANSVDANGKRPADLISLVRDSSFNSQRNMLEFMLNGGSNIELALGLDDYPTEQTDGLHVSKDGPEKKEYPVDPSLPDIKNGIYGTDEFRMYAFKVWPCSRAYSHDWTECPFVHPGENARRRDPGKFHYSSVPCPDFRKGSCQQGDACEYAHGIFECWLHPAQYRTRLCKDGTNCARRVCFFAHKPEELRPLYASTGSAVPSPQSFGSGASVLAMASVTTPPPTPPGASSPIGGSLWANQSNAVLPTLQLPGSRLRSALNAIGINLDADLLGLDGHHLLHHQLLDDSSSLGSPSGWTNVLGKGATFASSPVDQNGEVIRHNGSNPTNLDDTFGTLDSRILSQLQGLSVDSGKTHLLSPNDLPYRHNVNQHLNLSYTSNIFSPSGRASSSFEMDPLGSKPSVFNSRSAAFAKRSQSFIDRSTMNRHSGFSSSISSAAAVPSTLSDWRSPDGKLDWGVQKEEIDKLRKSASFGFRNSGNNFVPAAAPVRMVVDEPDAHWVQSVSKDVPFVKPGDVDFDEMQHEQCYISNGGSETLTSWADQLYNDQEQIVA